MLEINSIKNGIVIDDPYISGKHARFTLQNGTFYIQDAGSTNGTFVNGVKIDSRAALLKNGDRIQIGQLEFLFVSGSI